jgi:hypothetical protein
MTRRRLYQLPRTSGRSNSRYISRLSNERRNLETISERWDEEVIASHIGRAVGSLQQQQRKLEKMFSQMLQQALKVNTLKLEQFSSSSGDASPLSNLFPRMDNLLERSLSQALSPKARTRTTVAETERSRSEASRFRASASDVHTAMQATQAKNLRNR